ncbi:hypothetical protein [Vibrio vulnificus YJ016]|uniref:Rap1a immunity protein domain-containing protein n=1 Tax=Vibrio vulnificus (strain YJ016) TaxID=196600 RepID=Q7MJG6_VIBVY|nr:hypothetical protein [Vibrio vulnificus]ARN66363.1 hypothetical protein FORC36_1846 [Vibrio vulnificus]EGQ9293264.1 hypothetical protein [Vibrio vulnificus]EID4424671.1 hypothetical protein [Vibrio vulnificus]EIO3936008.1 hypothetical protein [Vibrio vulnificus]EJU9787538.1 hypothetical protein [Vibrio vulnificus]
MKPIHYLIASLALFTAPSSALVHFDERPGSVEFLISACREYIELYQKKDQPRFGAFLTTSKEESFRAGYCLGAIMHTNSTCTYSVTLSVYRSAEAIASVSNTSSYSESLLLERTVCR